MRVDEMAARMSLSRSTASLRGTERLAQNLLPTISRQTVNRQQVDVATKPGFESSIAASPPTRTVSLLLNRCGR